MNIYLCDGCGEPMMKTKYKVDIFAINVQDTPLLTAEAASYNISNGLRKGFRGEQYYCRECIKKIEGVLAPDAGISEKMDD